MSKFAQRSSELELMDYPIEDKAEIFQNFSELVFINQYLGGPVHSFNEIKRLLKSSNSAHIADIGSGAGDFLDYLYQRRKHFPAKHEFTGVDLMPEAHEFASERFSHLANSSKLMLQDYRQWLQQGARPDIIHASLFCHHLTQTQLVEFFKIASENCRVAVVVNDLHRHPLAYYSIKWLTQLFSKSRFTKNDAPLSVLRGFTKEELKEALTEAGISDYQIKWKWAFRFIITIPSKA